jgi:hypothetical protein
MKRILTFLVLILFSFSVSCGGSSGTSESSTDDGDSGEGTSDDTVGTEESRTYTCSSCYEPGTTTKTEVGVIIVGLCTRLTQCDDNTSLNPCLYYANSDAALIAATGADSSTYATFEALQTAIDAGEVTQALADYADCNNSMPSITCSSFTDADSYDEITGVYSGFTSVLTDACRNIYTDS